MATAQAIAEHLPYLRRYARALAGSQSAGDSYVRACLEAIVADQSALQRDVAPKVALYRLFHAMWNSANGFVRKNGTVGASAVEGKLHSIKPIPRQALLLRAMEGFSPADVATILDLNEREVQPLLQAAVDEITKQPRTTVLIIEDEPIISLDLQGIVGDMGHKVAAVATTRSEAVAAAKRVSPGLVLADIKLADGSSGLDAVKEILSDVKVPTVFITAYPERLLTGERPEPTFLVTKPFMPETVRVTISQALLFT